jgi:hypothetical protein
LGLFVYAKDMGADAQNRDQFGRFIKVTTKTPSLIQKPAPIAGDPPLISLQVTNPVTYLKLWLSKFLRNDEISLTIRIRPSALISTAIAIAILMGGLGVSLKYLFNP